MASRSGCGGLALGLLRRGISSLQRSLGYATPSVIARSIRNGSWAPRAEPFHIPNGVLSELGISAEETVHVLEESER